ncbi:MAG: DedA family protein [Deltaproteobacteria bacterium]|nr:DedA family protein [Deltaproteobacteria bacterium]
MTLEAIIGTYGYLVLLVGTFFEGETVLVLAGFAAHLGYLRLPWVIAVAFAGTLCIDQFFFYLGRRHRWHIQAFLAKHPRWLNRAMRVQRLVETYRTPLVLGFRFLYGLRSIAPFVIGTGRIPARTFLLLNIVSALAWATAVGTAGFLFGHLLTSLLGDIKRIQGLIMALVAVAGVLIWVFLFFFLRRSKPPRKGK